GNILLGPVGPRLSDAGLVHALAGGNPATVGLAIQSTAYLAPEQTGRVDEPLGREADLFSWAATMAYAATGRAPFGADAPPNVVMSMIADGAPDVGGIPDGLRRLLLDCLHKRPAERPTAEQVLL